jgi:hypothetical protein
MDPARALLMVDDIDIDPWGRKVLTFLDAKCGVNSNAHQLLDEYSRLPRPARSALLKCCPFRFLLLRCLRALAASADGAERREQDRQTQPRDDLEGLRHLVHLARRADAWTTDRHHVTAFHKAGCTVIGYSGPEAQFFNTVFDDEFVAELVADALRKYCSDEVSNVRASFSGFGCEQQKALEKVLEAIEELPRRFAATVGQHVSVMFFVTYPTEMEDLEHGLVSAHHPLVPNSFFLSKKAFNNFGELLELMYHEALHNELEALSLVAPLYQKGVNPAGTPMFNRPWGDLQIDNCWTFDRAFHAHYVYFHLADLMSYFSKSELVSIEIRDWGRSRLETCRARGLQLAAWLLENGSAVLSGSGFNMVRRSRELLSEVSTRIETGQLLFLGQSGQITDSPRLG